MPAAFSRCPCQISHDIWPSPRPVSDCKCYVQNILLCTSLCKYNNHLCFQSSCHVFVRKASGPKRYRSFQKHARIKACDWPRSDFGSFWMQMRLDAFGCVWPLSCICARALPCARARPRGAYSLEHKRRISHIIFAIDLGLLYSRLLFIV